MIPLVGNDVVDLQDPQSRPEALHPRWDSRVFNAAELELLSDPASAHRMRWAMWASKEAAFKVAAKLVSGLSFFPTAFAVEMRDPATARVRHSAGDFTVRLQHDSAWVQAVATPTGSPSAMSELERTNMDGAEPEDAQPCSGGPSRAASLLVRSLARRAIGRALSIDAGNVEITEGGGAPVATSGGAQLPVDLSLSHHGRFVACAWVLQ